MGSGKTSKITSKHILIRQARTARNVESSFERTKSRVRRSKKHWLGESCFQNWTDVTRIRQESRIRVRSFESFLLESMLGQ